MGIRRIGFDNISGGQAFFDMAYIKGYETNKDGMPTSIFFGSGMSWPIAPTEENRKKLESLNL